MEYSDETKNLALRYNVKAKDILFCRLIAAGADRADAYAAIYHNATTRQTREQAASSANEWIAYNPGARLIINYFKRGKTATKNDDVTEDSTKEKNEEGKDFTSRQGILKMLQRVTSELRGKDELQGLITVAKIQGFDRPDEHDDDERRAYFLPWVSNCRACELMRAYIKATKQSNQESD